MPLITKGFEKQIKLLRHFQDHRLDFNSASPQAYETAADTFMSSPLNPPVKECIRTNGDVIRYNPATQEFGILDSSRYIITYYRLSYPTQKKRDDYFKRQCSQ